MHLESFIVSALLLLAVTSVAVALFRRLGLGSVLGLLIAGIVVGPHSPGPYITPHVEDVRHFTELGVVLLLFVIGLEIKPDRLWSLRRDLLGLGSLQILLSGSLLTAYVLLGTESWKTALFIGLSLSLSSTAFVMQLLHERGEFASRYGAGAFAVLLAQDLSVVPLLALIPLLSDTAAISSGIPLWEQLLILLAMFAALVVFGRLVVPHTLEWLARQGNREAFLLVILLAVLLAAWAMHQAGLSMALGAFLMGMLLSGSRYNMQIRAFIEPYKGLLMSMFFVAVGMSIDLGQLAQQPIDFFQHTIVLIGIKLAVLFLLAIAFGYSRSNAVRITCLLAQAGEFGFVLFGSALVLGVIDEPTFVMVVGVISLSMLLTPLLVKVGSKLAEGLDAGTGSTQVSTTDIVVPEQPVLIGGYGRVGHTIATLLETSGVPFVAFDIDPQRVAQGQEYGHHVLYGDIADADLLTAAHTGQSKLVVLTINHEPTALQAVSHLRNMFPQVPIIARAKDLEACTLLLEAGVTQAHPEALEASLRLGAEALQMVGATRDNTDLLLQGVRDKGYILLHEEAESDENDLT
ncbi:MAG: portal protein [Gammaproteobacteria bacterium]|nr:portal protein [Gammaproteobacteria bacterium]